MKDILNMVLGKELKHVKDVGYVIINSDDNKLDIFDTDSKDDAQTIICAAPYGSQLVDIHRMTFTQVGDRETYNLTQSEVQDLLKCIVPRV